VGRAAGGDGDGLSLGIDRGDSAQFHADGLRRGCAVYDLKINLAGLAVARRIEEQRGNLHRRRRGWRWSSGSPTAAAAGGWLPFARGDALRINRKNQIAVAGTEHLLRPIGRRAVALEPVVADQIRMPLHGALAHIDEER